MNNGYLQAEGVENLDQVPAVAEAPLTTGFRLALGERTRAASIPPLMTSSGP